jgi:glycosyltransferase involved in cell wall biosynthesis
VVVDDGSSDGTPELVRALDDNRLRLVARRNNLGPSRTWNESVSHAGGALLKFLHQDDELLPGCVAAMANLFERHDSVGMVFCRRRVTVSGHAATYDEWARRFGEIHGPLMPLAEANSGRVLLTRWWSDNAVRRNCVGEPVAVMVRRQALDAVGLFHAHMRQLIDAELWVRIMSSFDVGFVDDELVTYATGPGSLTTRNERDASYWVDRLWMLETLARCGEGGAELDNIEAHLKHERKVVRRTLVSLVLRRTEGLPLRPAIRYLAWRAHGGRQPK